MVMSEKGSFGKFSSSLSSFFSLIANFQDINIIHTIRLFKRL